MKENKCIIFDMDGVLSNTNHLHYLSWKAVTDFLNIPFTNQDYLSEYSGVNKEITIKKLLAKYNVDYIDIQKLYDIKDEKLKQLISKLDDTYVFLGVTELLKTLKANYIKIIVYSASRNVYKILKKTNLTDLVDYVVDISKGLEDKSKPENYQKILSKFHVIPKNCIGIEDSNIALKSMKYAGIHTIGVGSHISNENGDFHVVTFSEIDFKLINSIFESNLTKFKKEVVPYSVIGV